MFWKGRNKFRDLEFVDKMGGTERVITNPSQWFTEESATKLYPIGTKLVVEDMVFRYCHAEADPGGTSSTIRRNRAVVFKHIPVTASAVVAAAVGAKSVVCTVAGVTADLYENGSIIQQPTVNWDGNAKLRIKSNTLLAFELKEPLVYAIATTDNLFFSKNHYSDVGKIPTNGTGKEYMSWVAVPQIHVTPSYYFWGQTWGPCCVQFGEGTPHLPGESPSERYFGFDYYGAAIFATNDLHQHAGFVLPNTWGTFSMLMMLQIAP